jgi:hypothetical protein
MQFASSLKRIDALIAAAERERRPEKLQIFHATDFLTGSPWPGFARAAGDHGTVLATIERAEGEPYREFETRATTTARDARAMRLVYGGIPTPIPGAFFPPITYQQESPDGQFHGPEGPPTATVKTDKSHPDTSAARRPPGLVSLLDPCLHRGQVEALRLIQGARFVVLRNGRRWGKTRLIEALIVDAVLLGRAVAYCAPIYALTAPTVANLASILGGVAERVNRSALPRSITMPGGGSAEFWSLDNQRVGRSRRYDALFIDEAAHVEHTEMSDMNLIYDASLMPTLLDRRGSVLVTSTPSGIDETQWFWRINNVRELGFEVYHAPTSSNPHMPADEIERLRISHNPLVFSQEYEGNFVDLSGVALFDINKMLIDGQPLDIPELAEHFEDEDAYRLPKLYDRVFMTIDATLKGGPEGDASAFLIVAENQNYALPKGLIVLDWFTSEAGEGDLDRDFKFIVSQYIKYARRARHGARAIYIEDTGLGCHLIRANEGLGTEAFDPGWVALGKGPKVMASLPFVNRGEIKLTRTSYQKRSALKNTLANHLRMQLLNFRLNDKKMRTRADDLVDVFTMAVIKGWDLEVPT